ncbi:hypothetical protein GCK32_019688, partial [Trichostrongylus colubriformis]
MVRTYTYNPSTQGSFFDSAFTSPSTSSSSPQSSTQPALVERQVQNNEIVPVRQRVTPTDRCVCNVVQPQFTPFHSPYVDPIGSIVGLRVSYMDGKLCYVPLEPQLNFMINQQFGNGFCVHCARKNGFFSPVENAQINYHTSNRDNNGDVHPADPIINHSYQEKYTIDSRPMHGSTATASMQNPQRIRQS